MVARMPLEHWIQHCTVARVLYDWQTLIAGVLALLAALWTIRETVRSADREIAASQKQMDPTVRLEQRRAASEGYAFHAMLAAAMTRVLDEANEAEKLVFGSLPTDGPSMEAYEARTHLTKLGHSRAGARKRRSNGRYHRNGKLNRVEAEIFGHPPSDRHPTELGEVGRNRDPRNPAPLRLGGG